MKRRFLLLCLLAALGGCGGNNNHNSDIVGTWIADLFISASGEDSLANTLVYNSDTSAQVRTDESIQSGTWRTEGGRIITTLPDISREIMSEYSLMNSDNILETMTEDLTGSIITEYHYRMTLNFPSELVGTWTPISATADGAEVNAAELPQLVLAADGTGSFSWSVTEGRLLMLDPVSLIGQAYEYAIAVPDGGAVLLTTTGIEAGQTVTVSYTNDEA